QDARPPAGSNRVHPAADDRRPLVGAGDVGGQPLGADRPESADPIARPGSVHGSGFSARADSRSRDKTHGLEETMSRFSKIKIPLLLVFSLAAAAAAILIGAGFVGGSSSASDRSLAKAGAWRRVAQAPKPIASSRTT